MKNTKRNPDLYKASNVTFNAKTITADSYGWWIFVRVIRGQVVFNRYFYSPSTSKHQHKVRNLMGKLGIKVDREVSFRTNLAEITNLMDLKRVQAAQDKFNAKRAEQKRIERNEKARIRRARLAYEKDQLKQVENITQDTVPVLRFVSGGAQ